MSGYKWIKRELGQYPLVGKKHDSVNKNMLVFDQW
jgi:hypothetical protein